MAVRHLLWKNQHVSHLCSLRRFTEVRQQVLMYSTPPKKNDEALNEDPVAFSTSKAADFDSLERIQSQGRTNRPFYEPQLAKFCVAVFMIYFCILREESDWDAELSLSLFERVPAMELVMLRDKKKNSLKHGGPVFTEADQLRMEELIKQLE